MKKKHPASKNYMYSWYLGQRLEDQDLWHYCASCAEVQRADMDSNLVQRCDAGHPMLLMEYCDLPINPHTHEESFIKPKMYRPFLERLHFLEVRERRCFNVHSSER